jgi:putative ABC transport system permease protein
VKALDKKLLRDLVELWGQVLTIALVVACGIASFVTMRSAFDSLVFSRDGYYERQRFADVFAHLERAPETVADRVRDVPGVGLCETRITKPVTVPIQGMDRPATGTLISLPASSEPALDALHLERGRQLDPNRSDEVLVLDSFARAHGLRPGDRLPAVINGTLRQLLIVGVAMSPEFVFTLTAGAVTQDPKNAVVLWMTRDAVAAAFRMEGAFNDLLIRMQPGASEAALLALVERELLPYGVVSVVPRAKQSSHYILSGELQQLENMASVIPFIFLFVAAFLLNVVLSRLVYLQRSQIATLKAVGYSDVAVGLHYLELVVVIVLVGAVLGIATGAWLGRELTELYTGEYFRFPNPVFRLELRATIVSVLVSLGAAVIGALSAVRHVTSLPPAEAMRPPAPTSYRRSWLERIGVFSIVGPSGRMVLREVVRRPLRLGLSSLGIALALGIVVVAGYFNDAIDYLLDIQFHRSMREDVMVGFVKPLPERAIRELERLPGVWRAEGMRSVPVRFVHGPRHRDAVINGFPHTSTLRHVLDQAGHTAEIPPHGLLLTKMLGEVLKLELGDRVEVETRIGARRRVWVEVVGFTDEPFGMQGHMATHALHQLLGEERAVDAGLLRVDPEATSAVYQRLRRLPWVGSVGSPRGYRDQFEAQSGDVMRIYTFVLTLFASIIAIGVVYNNARVALSQRSRDLASLRVLGFTRAEISRVLLGELSVQVLLAIPLGLVCGYWMVRLMAINTDPETFRLPVYVSARTYAFAVTVTLVSALVSALLVRRQLDRLDLISVLKTRE